MIDLYFAEFHIELIESEGGKLVTVDCAMMRELITRLRQAEKDAARYRWLCSIKMYDQFDSIDQVFYDNKVDTDAAIDESMKCNK